MAKKKIPPLKSSSIDDKNAKKEAESIANEDLEKQAKTNEHHRKEKFRGHFLLASLIIFWIVVSCFVSMGIIWFWHVITPDNSHWHFLNNLQIEKLQTFLFSAAIIKIGQGALAKNLG